MTRWLYSLCLLLLGVPALASPQSALAASLADAETLPYDVRIKTRYLEATELRPDALEELAKPLAFHVNQLSVRKELIPLQRIDGAQVYRVVLTDYGWDAKVWDKLAETDPWYHVQAVAEHYWPGGTWPNDGRWYAANSFRYKVKITDHGFWLDRRQIDRLAYLTQAKAPLLNANWFFVQTARQLNLQNKQTGAGYYDFLGIKDRKTFLALAATDEKLSIKFGFDLRAALERSGVSQEGRQVGWLRSYFGPVYFTLDADSNTDKNNPIRNLARGDYKHKAEEWYLGLPNGLFAFGLFDNNGKRQDTAPDFIGPDKSPLNGSNDGRIHVGLSCVRCHVEGLRPVDDWVRRTLRNPAQLQADDYNKFVELRNQYFSDLDGQLKKDRAAYAEAVKAVNGLSPADNAKAYAALWDRYVETAYGTREIAVQMGIEEPKLIAALKGYAKANYGKIDLVLVGLLAIPQTPLRVEHFEELSPLLWKIVRDHP